MWIQFKNFNLQNEKYSNYVFMIQTFKTSGSFCGSIKKSAILANNPPKFIYICNYKTCVGLSVHSSPVALCFEQKQ